MESATVTIAIGTIVVCGVGAQWLGRKTGIPSIVLLLLSGIIVGPVTGLVDPEALLGDSLDPAITFAVGLLLFDSGFSLRFRQLQTGRDVVSRLVSIGLLITWAVGAGAAYLLFDMPASVALLLGAVLVVSGPTVVGPILAAARPAEDTDRVLRWEGTVLDPIGAALGVAILTVITTETLPILGTLGLLLVTAATGIAIGLACAAVLIVALRYFVIPDDLQVPVAFMFAVVAFCAANVVFSEAGLFATLTLGLALANQRWAYVARVRSFGQVLGTLVIGTLFIVLAATIELSALWSVLGRSAVLLVVLVVLARPLSAFAATLRSSMSASERGFVASVAPRGIVAASTVSFYAISLKESGIDADEIVPITFAIIIGAGVVYGFGAPWMARLLKVTRGTPTGVAFFMPDDSVSPLASALGDAGVSVLVVDEETRNRLVAQDLSYILFGDGVEAEGLGSAMSEANIGTAVIGTGLGERDLIAMNVAARELGSRNVHYVPRAVKGTETGPAARWRKETPDRLVAFGPDVTRDRLAELVHGSGELQWLPVGTDAAAIPEGTIPLFIVNQEKRAVVANQSTISKARRGAHKADGVQVLCVHPHESAPADPRHAAVVRPTGEAHRGGEALS